MQILKKTKLILLIALITLSCQRSGEKNVSDSGSKAFTHERNAFFNSLLAPSEVALQLKNISEEYNDSLTSNSQNYLQYVTTDVKAAANMGVYISDLNYSIAYSQKDKIKEYFKASYELSKIIEIEKSTLTFLLKRYEENIEQNDSVKAVINELWSTSLHDLQGTRREKLAGVAMAAYQIENLHIALGLLESYFGQDTTADAKVAHVGSVFKLVVRQRTNIDIIYHFLKSFSDPLDPDNNPNYLYYSDAFGDLIAQFKKLEENNVNEQALLTDESAVKELKEKVDAIRNKITSVE